MSFLTLVQNQSSSIRTIITLILSLSLSSIARAAPGSSFELSARANLPNTSANLVSPAIPWLIGLICIVLFGVMLATLWPSDNENNLYKRQRKFARIDGLFFKIKGFVLGEEESRMFLRDPRLQANPKLALNETAEGLTLLSLSFGGCSIICGQKVKKGAVILLELNSLPDFPAKNLIVAAKVVWARSQRDHSNLYEVAGAKFISASAQESAESLRQYLNYLMDEPVT